MGHRRVFVGTIYVNLFDDDGITLVQTKSYFGPINATTCSMMEALSSANHRSDDHQDLSLTRINDKANARGKSQKLYRSSRTATER